MLVIDYAYDLDTVSEHIKRKQEFRGVNAGHMHWQRRLFPRAASSIRRASFSHWVAYWHYLVVGERNEAEEMWK